MNDPYTKKWLLNDSKYPPIACFVTIATPSCRLVSFSAFESGMVGFVQFNVSLSWFTVAYYVLFCCFCYSHLSILFALVPSSVAIATSDVLLHFFFFLRLAPSREEEKGEKEMRLCVRLKRYGVVLPRCVLMLHHASLFFSLFALSTPRWPHPSVIFDGPFLPSQRPCWFTDRLHNMQWAGNSYACGCMLTCSLGGRLQGCTHAQQHASFVKIPKPSRHAVFRCQQLFL